MQKRFKINHLFLYSGLLVVGLFAFTYLIKTTPVKAAAGINQTINFQGRLLNNQGATVPDGFYNIQFKIYQDGDGQTAGDTTGSPAGTLKWTESYLNNNSQGVKVINGYLSVNLGSITPFGSNIDWNQSVLWLSMNIGNTNTSCTPFSSCGPDGEMVPMQPMTAAPYSLNSGALNGLTSSQFVQIANGLQTDASNAETISINKTGSGNILDLQKSGSSVFLISNSGQTTISTTAADALLVSNATGTDYLSVDTSGGVVNIGVTGAVNSDSTIHIADSSAGVQTVTIGSTNSSSSTTINAGSGGISLNGNVNVSANNNFTQSGTGTFSTGSGANTLNGDTSIASGKNFTQNGAGTFSTGSGTNSLNGNTTVASNKSFTANGAALFKDASNSASAFQVQNNSSFNVLAVDTSVNHLKVYDGTATQAYIDIYYDDATSSGIIAASTGTTKIGNGSGPVTLNSGAGSAVTITGHATSVWSLDSGDLTIDVTSASTPNLNIGTGAQAKNINIGNGTGATAVNVQCGTGTCSFGANSTTHSTTVGSTVSTSGTTIQSGSGGITLNGDTTVSSGKNFTQSGSGTFSTGSGTNTLNGDTTVSGTKNFTVNGGNTNLGGNLDVTGSAAFKQGTDFSTTGVTNNANFGNTSLVRLTGASAQTITGIANGRNGYLLTLVNAGSNTVTLTNDDTNSSAANRITTGGGNISLQVGANITLVYDSVANRWRGNGGNTTSLQNAYNNSSSPQISLSSANGGLVVQDASSPIGADLFTVQSNGGATKYFNVTSSTVAITDNLTVSGTYNGNTFNSTTLQFSGASGTVSSGSGNLTIQAAGSNSLLLDTAGAGTVAIATNNATTVNVASNNVAHNIHIGDGGTSAQQTITIGSTGNANSSITLNSGSTGGVTANGSLTVNGGVSITGSNTFTTGSGAVDLNGDTTIASGKNFTQSGGGTFSTGSGTNTLNGNTTVATGKTFTVTSGNTTLGANLDVTGSEALKKGTDFSTTGTTNNASFSNASLIRLTGSSAQTITGIAGGRDGYILTLVNAGNTAATLTNNDSNSSPGNRISTGGGSIALPVGAQTTLIYDSSAAVWRASSGNSTTLQNAYNNSTTSPQIVLSSANGGLVVQDAITPIGADLFTVQSNGAATKYFNVTSSAVAVNENLTVSGTYNTNTFTSTSLAFGGASGSVSSTGNLTIQAGSTNALILDTTGSGNVSLGGSNATTINVGTSNVTHNIHIGDGGTSASQTITIGSSGNVNSTLTLNAGSTGGITANGSLTVNGGVSITGTNSFSTGTGSVSLNGDTTISANHNFTQNGTGTFSTGSGANNLNGDTTIATDKNFTQNGTGTFSTGSGANSLNGDTTIASGKNFTQSGSGTFSTGSGTNTLNGDTTVSGTKNFTVNGGNTNLGGNLDVTGSTALKKGTDFSTTGTTNNASFANASLIRLTGTTAQTITGIAGGRDGYILNLVNAGSNTATITNNDSNSSAANRIITGTGSNLSLLSGATLTLVYDSASAVWRAGSTTSLNNLQTAYDNSTSSPQITLSSANGGLVVQDASSAIGADLFTVQSNGGASKYFNVTSSTVAITDNLTVSGTYNTNTFTSTSLAFGGASGSVSSTGNLTIQAGSSNALILDTTGSGNVSLGGSNATTINVGTSNVAHTIHIGDGGTSAQQTIAIGSTGNVNSSLTLNSGSTGGITANGTLTVNGSVNITGTNSFSTGTGSVSLNGDTTISANHNFTQNGTGSFTTGSGAVSLNGDTTVATNKNFTQGGTGTFSTGSGANSLNGDTTIASGKNFTQSGGGTFSTGSGTNTLNGDTTVSGTKTFTVNGGNTSLGARLDVTGSTALKKGTDFSTTGTTNNASFGDASLIRLTGASAQTITGIASGRDGYILTLVNAGSTGATITNNDSNSNVGNRILTGTGNSITMAVNTTISLVYDSTSAIWRAGTVGGTNNLQTAYNNSTSSPQIVLSSANGGLVVQDASTPIGADLFTVQSNGGATKYFNITSSTVAITDNLTVSGTYNTNTFTSTSLAFGGASGSVTSTGNLTIQAGSSNALILDTTGSGNVSLGGTNATTINVGTSNIAHTIHIGDGGTSAQQTIAIGSSGNVNSTLTLNAGSTGGITANGSLTVNGSVSITGTNSFSTGSGSVALNGDTTIAANKNFTQNGTGTFTTGSGAVSINGDTTIAANKNFTQNGTGTFSTGSGANSLNGDTTIASGKNFTQSGGGTFSTGSGTNTLNGDTTVSGTKNLTVSGGNTSLGGNLDVTGSAAFKKGTDFSTNGTTNNASFANASLIRLTGTSAQTITGIAGGRDGYILTLVNAGNNTATITNNDGNSTAGNRVITGTGGSISIPSGSTITLVYDITSAVWRSGSIGGTNLQTAYNNSTSSPQIVLSSTNGGLVVQDASSPIGADLFTVQSNGGATKYFNVTSSTVAITDNLTVSGTYNTNTFTSTSLAFGGASGSVSSTGNLTIQAGSTNSLLLDTSGAGSVGIATSGAATINVATNNATHNIHIGDGGTSAQQTIAIGSTGNVNSSITLNAGSTGGVTVNGNIILTANNSITQQGAGTLSTGTGQVSLNGNTTIASNKSFTANGSALFKPGTDSATAFQVQPSGSTTPVLDVDTSNNRVGINTNAPGASLSINSGTAGVSGLQFTQLNNTSSASSSFSQLLGLDSSGNVGLSSAGISLTSPALAYWDGANNPTTGSQSYPLATLSGNAAYDGATNGVRLTSNTNNQSGSINWSFSQVNFEETQFQFKAGGGTGADSTWFYSYANATPSTEYGSGFASGYLIYFSEYHHCVGIAYGGYSDGNQCGSGGGTNPLTSVKLNSIADNTFHAVDIQIRQNVIIVRWDSKVILTYTDVYTRDLSALNFGFGSRTGGSNNNHYIKGLLVTKLGTNASQYNITDTSPLASNLTWDNVNEQLGVGSYNPDATLDVHGTTSLKSVVTSAGTVYQGSGNVTTCTASGTSGYTSNTTVTGSGTSFSTAGVLVGDTIVLPDGVKDTITAVNSNTSLTVSGSRAECPGTYKIVREVFNTSGSTVQIGSSTTDARPILLTLDSYNQSSDPTGINGAMYYNTSLNSFRCYANGSWSSCGGIWQTLMKGSDQAKTNQTLANDTDLTFSMAANTNYSIRCQIYWFQSGTGGIRTNYSGPSSPTSVVMSHYGLNGGTAGAIGGTGTNTGNTGTNATLTSTANTGGYMTYNGEWDNGGNAGTWVFQFARSTANGTTTVRQGSYCDYASF